MKISKLLELVKRTLFGEEILIIKVDDRCVSRESDGRVAVNVSKTTAKRLAKQLIKYAEK